MAQDRASAAEVIGLPLPYCVPGLTAERCRGTFWETGKMYKKPVVNNEPVSPDEVRD